jgi:hypothetical protein
MKMLPLLSLHLASSFHSTLAAIFRFPNFPSFSFLL